MAKKVGSTRGKKCVTNVKRANKIRGKLASKVHRKEKAKRKTQEKRKEDRKKYDIFKISKTKRDMNEQAAEEEITGEDMMSMLDTEELDNINRSAVTKPAIPPEESDGKIIRKLLPIRTQENEWLPRQIEMKSEPIPQVEKKEEEVEKDDELDIRNIHTVVQLASERLKLLEKRKITIANLALKVIKDSNNTAFLSALLSQMKEEENPLVAITVKKCATLTLLQVFQDILPGYTIIEDILKQRLKKETLQVVKEELSLLQHYSNYLKQMEKYLDAFKSEPNNSALQDLAQTALNCFGELLVQRPSFNYSDNIVNLMVPFLNHKNDGIRQAVYLPLSATLRNDVKGKFSLKIMRKIYQMAKRTRYRLKSDVLKLFLSFRLRDLKNSDVRYEIERNRDNELKRRERNIKKLAEKFAKKPSKRQKKEKKKMVKLKVQMGDIHQQSLNDHHSVEHSQILELVLGIYFHILKNKPKSKLIGCVLEGLAKFAHLINIEYFSDILKTFSSYLEDGTFDLQSSLYCMSTVFTILACQDEMLNLDPLRFYKHFYSTLLRVAKDPLGQNLPIALRVMESMLIRRKKKITGERVLAFTKRLATLVPALVHHGATASCLATLRSLMMSFPINEALLDPDPDGSLGMFSPDVEEPDHAHAISTALWELHMMRRHYHTDVQKLSLNILQGCPQKGNFAELYSFTKRSAQTIYEDYEPSQLSFHPSIPLPSDHLRKVKNGKLKRSADSFDMMNLNLEMRCQEAIEESPIKKAKLDFRPMDFFCLASRSSCPS